MTQRKLYKVNFRVKCYCDGIFSYADAHLTVLAESEQDAIQKVRNNTQFEISTAKANCVKTFEEDER